MSGRLSRAVDALSAGTPIVLGSTLVLAAELASPESVAFLVRHSSGRLRNVGDVALLDRTGSADGLGLVARLHPNAVVAELDGSPASACRFAHRHDLEFITAEDLRSAVLPLAGARLPTRDGDFQAEAFATLEHPDRHHLALVRGDPAATAPLVRVHAACPAERFGSLVCDCAARLRTAMAEIAAVETGVLIYLRGPGAELHTCTRGSSPDLDVADAILRALRVREKAAA